MSETTMARLVKVLMIQATFRSNAMAPWFVFYATNHTRSAHGLVEAGFEVFAPTYQKFIRRRAFKHLEPVPLLPGYVFARVPDGRFETALGVECVAYVLRADGAPRAVPERIIADIQTLVESGKLDERLPVKKARPRRQRYQGLAALNAWFDLQKTELEPLAA